VAKSQLAYEILGYLDFKCERKVSNPSLQSGNHSPLALKTGLPPNIIFAMKKILPVLIATFALLGISTAISHAEPPYHLTTVSWIISTRNNMDVDDRYVTLVGQVTQRIGDESYWFTDGTGSVRLDSADFVLPIGPKVVIGGRIDQAYLGFGHLEVDVRHWHFVKHP
jgi:uncharacterized protein YdeI (BOF family)